MKNLIPILFIVTTQNLFAQKLIPAPASYNFSEVKSSWIIKFRNKQGFTVPAGSEKMLFSTELNPNVPPDMGQAVLCHLEYEPKDYEKKLEAQFEVLISKSSKSSFDKFKSTMSNNYGLETDPLRLSYGDIETSFFEGSNSVLGDVKIGFVIVDSQKKSYLTPGMVLRTVPPVPEENRKKTPAVGRGGYIQYDRPTINTVLFNTFRQASLGDVACLANTWLTATVDSDNPSLECSIVDTDFPYFGSVLFARNKSGSFTFHRIKN